MSIWDPNASSLLGDPLALQRASSRAVSAPPVTINADLHGGFSFGADLGALGAPAREPGYGQRGRSSLNPDIPEEFGTLKTKSVIDLLDEDYPTGYPGRGDQGRAAQAHDLRQDRRGHLSMTGGGGASEGNLGRHHSAEALTSSLNGLSLGNPAPAGRDSRTRSMSPNPGPPERMMAGHGGYGGAHGGPSYMAQGADGRPILLQTVEPSHNGGGPGPINGAYVQNMYPYDPRYMRVVSGPPPGPAGAGDGSVQYVQYDQRVMQLQRVPQEVLVYAPPPQAQSGPPGPPGHNMHGGHNGNHVGQPGGHSPGAHGGPHGSLHGGQHGGALNGVHGGPHNGLHSGLHGGPHGGPHGGHSMGHSGSHHGGLNGHHGRHHSKHSGRYGGHKGHHGGHYGSHNSHGGHGGHQTQHYGGKGGGRHGSHHHHGPPHHHQQHSTSHGSYHGHGHGHHGHHGHKADRGRDRGRGGRRHPQMGHHATGPSHTQLSMDAVLGRVVLHCRDQHGSRFIQQKLELGSPEEKEALFAEILPAAQSLMTDVFGNYVVQKLFEHGSASMRRELAALLRHNSLSLALQMYGCRVVQKCFEFVELEVLLELIEEFEGRVLECVQDQNGNHVIQKAIEVICSAAKKAQQSSSRPFAQLKTVQLATPEPPPAAVASASPPGQAASPSELAGAELAAFYYSKVDFIVNAFKGEVRSLAMHAYGCRVIQRILEHCSASQKEPLLSEIRTCMQDLIRDQYGNYVTQHLINYGRPADRDTLIVTVSDSLLSFARHKFASNVVEKCLQYGSKEQRDVLIDQLIGVGPAPAGERCPDGLEATQFQMLVQDPYGNYVIQRVIDVADSVQRSQILTELRRYSQQLKRVSYGKHIISRIEKLSGEKVEA